VGRDRACAERASVRFLHTGDWHLGRTIRGRSRIDECARVLDEVVGVAQQENVDAVLIAGDTFDTFSPPSEAQKLLYETLTRLVRSGASVVMIAGNHDSASRMEALAGILELAGVHAVGSARQPDGYQPITIASRDGNERAIIVAVPWIPESRLIEYETLFGAPDAKFTQYAGMTERVLGAYTACFRSDAVNVLMGHMMISGTSVRADSGERKLHIGDVFAVPGQLLPDAAQYTALGHVHRPQPVANAPVAGGAFYAGSLLQLDFGEAEQAKSVRVADVKPRQPADTHEVAITGGTGLRNLRFRLEEVASHAGKYGDDYLRVGVEVDGPVQSLFEQVRDVLPNAIDVTAVRTDITTVAVGATKVGLEPHELLSRYYTEARAQPIPADLLALFNRMYEEAQGASA
jgi:DNA repair protein SbcD/Mre11